MDLEICRLDDIVTQEASEDRCQQVEDFVRENVLLQGENKVLGIFYEDREREISIAGGFKLYKPVISNADKQQVIRIISTTNKFDRELYPDVKPGAVCMIKPMAADIIEQDGVKFAKLDAQFIRYAYKTTNYSADHVGTDGSDENRQAIKEYELNRATAFTGPSAPIPSMIIVK